MKLSRVALWLTCILASHGCAEAPYSVQDQLPSSPEPEARPSLALNEVSCRGDEWVEVWNHADVSVSLEGWKITDRPSDAERGFVFGADAIVGAGQGLTTPLMDEGALNFSLSCDEDDVALVSPSGEVFDTAPLRMVSIGGTWGRLPDAKGPWIETRPTPGSANAPRDEVRLALNEVSCRDEWIEIINLGQSDVDLSKWRVDDGSETAAPHPLEGLTLAPGELGVVRQQTRRDLGFTFGLDCGVESARLLDPEGAVADEVALVFEPPAFSLGRLPDGLGPWQRTSPTPEESNAPPRAPGGSLFDPVEIVTIDLAIDEEMMARLGDDPRGLVPATFQLTDRDGQGEAFEINIRIKGRAGSLRPLDRKSAFKIKFNLEEGQRYRGLKRLTLNNMVQDRSMLHEWLAYTIVRGVGLHAPRVGYAFVRLNGQDYGLFANIETPDDVFLDQHFSSTRHLFEGAYGQDLFRNQVGNLEVDEGSESDRSELDRLVDLLDDPPQEGFFAATEALIDWPSVVKTMAVEVFVGHWDGYAPSRNNFYMHTDDHDVLSLMVWGTDQTFRDHLPINLENKSRQGRLFMACMEASQCQSLYNDALLEVLAFVEALEAEPKIRAMESLLRPWAERDVRREYSMEDIASAVTGTIDFLRLRIQEFGLYAECLLGPNPDPDNDGFACATDCDNGDPAVYPGAPEVCLDLIDQDCNGRVDDGEDCPDCHERALGPQRYLVCTTPRDRAEARAVCREEGMDLVVLDTPGEALWMSAAAMSVWPQRYWLGLDDTEVEGEFVWVDGSPLTYEDQWNNNEPNDHQSNEDCVEVLPSGRWNDIPCGHEKAVLCEAPCAAEEDADGDGSLRCGGDCDDLDPNINPEAEEVCRDGIDQDCSGVADDGDCISCEAVSRRGRQYALCTTAATWAEARVECRERGADLAIIDDVGEGDWINIQAAQRFGAAYWVGLHDPDRDNVFEWVDGSAGDHSNWGSGEPNDPGEGCVEVYLDSARWNDARCGRAAPFVCEFDQ